MSFQEHKITEYAASIAALPDKIENRAEWLKKQFDARTDSEVKDKHNGLCDALEAETAAADIGAAAPEGVTAAPAGKLQAVLNGLRDLVKAHTDRADNPHGVTAAQAGAYSKAETDAAISAKVVELGAGDMAKSIYDPGNEQQPLLPRNGDGSNVTASFTEAEQDADIQTGEELTVLFGKIKKRFSVVNKLVNGAVYPNLGTNTNFPNPINQRGAASYTGDSTSPYCIDRWRISNGTTYTVGTFTLSAANYANRACGMWQTNLLGEHWLSIGDNVTVSIYANGQLHTAVMQVLDRDSYSSFADVPAGYTCDDFEIVLCTYTHDKTKYNLGIYTKKPLTVNYIKWEKGSVATPYVPKGYGAELAECLRYFQRVHADWRIYPTLKDMLYRFSQSTLQVMRIKPTISAHGTPYTFGCTINALDAQPMAFTVETKITEQGQNAAAASMLGYFDLSADL